MGDVVLPRATIYLHGSLKRKFGGPYKWGVQTPAEAIRALDRMKPGFRDAIRKGEWMLISGPRHGGVIFDETMLDFRFGDGGMFHIVPAAQGRGSGGRNIGKIVVGVVLVVLAIYSGGSTTPLFGVLGAGGSVSASSVGMMGLGLVFSGAAGLLSPQPKPARPVERESVAENPSFMFEGPQMAMEQGRIVPVVYGYRVRVGGVLVSSGYRSVDVGSGSAA